jgi:uncharacterized membrane protein YqjE
MGEAPQRGGLLASLRVLLATLIETLHTRLELLRVELEEEKLRLIRLLAYCAAAFFLLGAGTVFFAIFVAVAFWDDHRLLVLGIFTAVFLGGGLAALFFAAQTVHAKSRLFAASLAELARDHRELEHDR